MGLVSILLHTVLKKDGGSLDPTHEHTLAQIPASITAALSTLNLDGRVTIYAVCPACHCTYKLRYKPGSTLAIYPSQCTNKPKPELGHCDEPLLHTRDRDESQTKPIKQFVYHEFMDYLASLLACPDIEAKMDRTCDEAMESINDPQSDFVKNIFEGEFL